MEALLAALQQALPSSERHADVLRIPEQHGSLRLVSVRAPWDPQVEHGFLFPWAARLEPALTLDACHLRARCLRSVDAIEAARALAEGRDVAASATLLAAEAARQIEGTWSGFTRATSWVGPGVEDMLRQVANAAPGDAELLLALLRAGAVNELGQREDARHWLALAAKSADPRIRRAVAELRPKLGDA